MTATNEHVDRALWKRFSKSDKDRCEICGSRAMVFINLTATERRAGSEPVKGNTGVLLVKVQHRFCDEHGQQRFAAATNSLGGVSGSRRGTEAA